MRCCWPAFPLESPTLTHSTSVSNSAMNPGAFGLTNSTAPCFDGSSVCANPNQYLFWDGFHPTTAADAILANQFATALTPEPSSILLIGTGISGLMVLVRKRRHKLARTA